MKKYTKILCCLFLISMCTKLHSQQNPYFTNFDGALADGQFQIPNGSCGIDLTDDLCASQLLLQIDCFSWNGAENFIPKFTDFECVDIDNSQLSLIQRLFCTMYIESPSIKEKLYGYASELEIGKSYKVSFYQRNIKNELASNDVDTSPAYGSKAYFKVNFGTETQNSQIMNYPPANNLFQYQEFVFQADSESEYFSIEPMGVLQSGITQVITRLAIDVIKIELVSNEPEEIYNPEDEIIVSNECTDCTSFELSRNEKYIVSGWVKQTDAQINAIQTTNYLNSYIEVDFPNTVNGLFVLYPSGAIIDGWQKMSGTITVPSNATEINIKLKNQTSNIAFFDDIRVHPYNGNLKSFVYDQETQRLMAELDENNFGTFYEYDQEGGLVRVKKETEKGVFTIQETRSSTVKKQ